MPRPKSELTSVAKTVSIRLIPAHYAEWKRLEGAGSICPTSNHKAVSGSGANLTALQTNGVIADSPRHQKPFHVDVKCHHGQ